MQKMIFFTVFISGMVSLAVEMTASRLLGNYFGASNLIWACIIGLILIYLAAGYFWGGRWADRSPHFTTFFKVLAWSALLIGLVPLAARPVLRFAAGAFDSLQLGGMVGAFAAVLILFSLPITLLGTASPFAVRLSLLDARQAGSISGRIYAISTLGSFLGTFLPVLVLIPVLGTYLTFVFCSGILLVTALVGLARAGGWKALLPCLWMPLVLVILAFIGTRGTDKAASGMLFEDDSAYNYIMVQQVDDYRILRLNEGQGVHSIFHPTELNYGGPWQQVSAAPFFNPAPYDLDNVQRIAIVGLAAGTAARQATAIYGEDVIIDGIEIDPEIVQVGQKYFGMTMPNLNVILEDGRVGLVKSEHLYQVISVDAYRPPYIPWHLTTREFFQVVYDHLSPDGVLVINVGRAPDDRRMVDALCATIGEVFPSVYVTDLPDSFNSMIFATRQATNIANLMANYNALLPRSDINPLLVQTLATTIANLQPTPSQGMVFTDDRAPVELITNDMVMRFLFSGGTELMD